VAAWPETNSTQLPSVTWRRSDLCAQAHSFLLGRQQADPTFYAYRLSRVTMEQTNDHASLASSNQEMDTASYPFRSNERKLDYYQWDNERNWRSCLKQGMRERGGCRPINCAKAYCLLHARGHLIPAHAWYTTPSPSIPMMFTNHSSGSTMTVPSTSTVEFHFHCPRIWVLISKGEREKRRF
jgi:hypothetical protein